MYNNAMKIGIDGQRLLDNEPAGPEIYTYNIIHALSRIDMTNEYTIYFNKPPTPAYFSKLTANNPKFKCKYLPKRLSWTQVSLAFELIKNPIDVFFTPVHTMPILRLPALRTVGMIHGLEYKYSAGYQHPLKKWLISKPEQFVCTFSDIVIVPSIATKSAIMVHKWPRVRENKIVVVPEGVSTAFYKRSIKEISAVKEKYGIGGSKYLLFVSTIQPRKNLPKLIEGFSMALKETGTDVKLLVAGKLGWLYDESLRAPKKHNVEENVIFLGRAADTDLPPLLSGAEAFVSASLEEGFGLPLLEALACETPALVSEIAAFKEVGRDIPIYINPRDAVSIKNAIVKIIQNEKDLERIENGKKLALNFTWERAAKQTLKLLDDVVKRKG